MSIFAVMKQKNKDNKLTDPKIKMKSVHLNKIGKALSSEMGMYSLKNCIDANE